MKMEFLSMTKLSLTPINLIFFMIFHVPKKTFRYEKEGTLHLNGQINRFLY